MAIRTTPEAEVTFQLDRGCLVKLKKGKPITLALEITLELQPGGGALKLRTLVAEVPRIVPKSVTAARR